MDPEKDLPPEAHNRRRRPVKTALAVFAAALLVRIVFISVHQAPAFGGDMITYDGTARNIVEGEWHFGWGDKPSAHREPIYPLFVAAIYKIAGPSREAVHWAQALLGAGTCALLVLLSALLLRSHRAAILAGLLASVYPPFLIETQTILTEPLATALVLLATYLVVIGWEERRSGALIWGGVVLGVATLTRAANLMYAPLLTLGFLLLPFARRRLGLALPGLFLLTFLAVLSPWIVRNYVVFGRFIPISVNAGGSFFRGNYDEGTLGSMGSNDDPRMPPEITSKYEGLDEVDIDRLLMREGVKYVRSHPGTFVKLCALKLARFWLNVGFAGPASRTSIAFAIGNGALLALALFGVLAGGVADHRAAAPVYTLVIYYTILHMLLFATGRYSMPVTPYVLALASAGLLGAANRLIPRRSSGSGPQATSRA